MFSSSLGLFIQHVYTWSQDWKIKCDIPAGTIKYGPRECSMRPDQQLWRPFELKVWSPGHDATAGKENETRTKTDFRRKECPCY